MNAVILEAKEIREAPGFILEGQAKECGLGNSDALRTIGEAEPVHQHKADHFSEGKRNDGQIVAAQAQHRKAEDDTPCRSKKSGKRQGYIEGPRHDAIAKPQRQIDRREQGIGVGANCIKRDVTEIEQSGQSHHDIQSPAQHHIGENINGQIDGAFITAGNDG